MFGIYYLMAQLACSSHPTEPVIGEASTKEARQWTDERFIQELKYSINENDSSRIDELFFDVSIERILRLETELLQIYKTTPATPYIYDKFSLTEPAPPLPYRMKFQHLLLRYQQDRPDLIERFMISQHLSFKKCWQIEIEHLNNYKPDYDSTEYVMNPEQAECFVVERLFRRCTYLVFREDSTPAAKEQVRDIPGCQFLRESIERDFSHWENSRLRLRSEEPPHTEP